MAKTTNVFGRVEPEVKEQAEQVLGQLGLSMSSAIGIFLNQVVLTNGLPFAVKVPGAKPVAMSVLTKEQRNAELGKGYEQYLAGQSIPAEDAFRALEQDG